MKKILKLKTIDEVRTMTDPYRTKIILIFQKYNHEPITVKTIAKEMGEPHGKVYYHVKKMLNVGALELVKTEKINGITAKYYQLTFDELKAEYDEDILPNKDEAISSYSQMISNYFNQYRDYFTDFMSQIDHETYDYKPGEKSSSVSGENLYFTEESYKEFQEDMKALVAKHAKKLEGEDVFKKTIFYAIFSELNNNND